MKHVLLVMALIAGMSFPVFGLAGSAAAVDVTSVCKTTAGNTDVCQDVAAQGGNNGNNNPIIDIIKAAINVLSYIIGIAAIIGITVSSIRLMTAGGDAGSAAAARAGLIYSLIGIAVVALAQALVAFVLNKVN